MEVVKRLWRAERESLRGFVTGLGRGMAGGGSLRKEKKLGFGGSDLRQRELLEDDASSRPREESMAACGET